MPRPDLLYLREMLQSTSRAREIVSGLSLREIVNDSLRRDALLWNFTVLGEAASSVSAEFRDAHPEIPWRRASDLRNRVVHGYWSLDLEILYQTAERDLPALEERLRAMVLSLAQE